MGTDSAQAAGNGGSQPAGQETLQQGAEQTSPLAAQLTSDIKDDQHFTGAELKKKIQDALSADGRIQKDRAEEAETRARTLLEQVNGLTGKMSSITEQLDAFRRARDEAEAESIKDDPEALKSLRTKQAQRMKEDQLSQRAAELKAKEDALATDRAEIGRFKAEKEARRIANLPEYKVDGDRLFQLVPDGNTERLKIAARILKESSIVVPVTPQANQAKPAGLTLRPASIVSVGGSEGNPVQNMLARAKAKTK